MNVIDFSPHHDNTTGKPDKIAIIADRADKFKRAKLYFEKYYEAHFPNGFELDFIEAKRALPKNSKVILTCCWNDIIGSYSLRCTNMKTIKANSWYWKYDYIGTLTDFANWEKKYESTREHNQDNTRTYQP